MGKFLPSKVKELNNNNIDNYISDRPNIPKSILFTDKKGNPLILKALSVAFDVRLTSLTPFREELSSEL